MGTLVTGIFRTNYWYDFPINRSQSVLAGGEHGELKCLCRHDHMDGALITKYQYTLCVSFLILVPKYMNMEE